MRKYKYSKSLYEKVDRSLRRQLRKILKDEYIKGEGYCSDIYRYADAVREEMGNKECSECNYTYITNKYREVEIGIEVPAHHTWEGYLQYVYAIRCEEFVDDGYEGLWVPLGLKPSGI